MQEHTWPDEGSVKVVPADSSVFSTFFQSCFCGRVHQCAEPDSLLSEDSGSADSIRMNLSDASYATTSVLKKCNQQIFSVRFVMDVISLLATIYCWVHQAFVVYTILQVSASPTAV
jgi:hypothetical protein